MALVIVKYNGTLQRILALPTKKDAFLRNVLKRKCEIFNACLIAVAVILKLGTSPPAMLNVCILYNTHISMHKLSIQSNIQFLALAYDIKGRIMCKCFGSISQLESWVSQLEIALCFQNTCT